MVKLPEVSEGAKLHTLTGTASAIRVIVESRDRDTSEVYSTVGVGSACHERLETNSKRDSRLPSPLTFLSQHLLLQPPALTSPLTSPPTTPLTSSTHFPPLPTANITRIGSADSATPTGQHNVSTRTDSSGGGRCHPRHISTASPPHLASEADKPMLVVLCVAVAMVQLRSRRYHIHRWC